MEIIVVGEHGIELAPERALVHMSVEKSSMERTKAVEEVTELANRLATALRESNAMEVQVEPLQVYDYWQARRRRHQASVSVIATFGRPEDVADFQAEWADTEGIDFGWVDWRLTEQTRREQESQVLTNAYQHAMRRARLIADAAGMGALTTVQISDTPVGQFHNGPMVAAANLERHAVEVNPGKIRVSAQLEVRFRAE